MLRLRFLGSLGVWLDEKPVRFPTRKSALLLAYLVAFRDRAHPRETLAGLFWGDAPQTSAHSSLRYALTTLRKTLPAPPDSLPYLLATGGTVRFNESAPFELDTLRLESALSQAQRENPPSESSIHELEAAVALYRGPFLEGFFEEWVLQEQMHWQDRFLEGVLHLTQCYESQGEHTRTIELCRRAIRFCPLHEPLYRALMRAYALQGDRNAALSQYEAFAKMLKKQLELEPLPETQLLYEQIVAHRLAPAAPLRRSSPAVALPKERVLFVGREDLLERILKRWKEIQQGERRALLLKGEPGIGKSLLLSEAIPRLRAQGGICLRAECLPTSPAPFEPLAQALQEGVTGFRVLLEALPRYLQTEIQTLIPAWGPSALTTLASSPDQLQARRFQALAELFRQLAQHQPICLVLDDLHLADESTLQWIDYAFRRLKGIPLLVLGSYRDVLTDRHPLSALKANLGVQRLIEEWEVPPLSPEQSALLLSQLLQRPLADRDPLNVSLFHLTGGNPFYLCALADGLKESGLLEKPWPQEADWNAQLVRYLPQTAQAALEERLRRLSARGRRLLEMGSILGHSWLFSLLVAVSGQRRPTLLETIQELLHARLLVEQGEHYSFQHDLIREYVYQRLTHAQRQYLHEKAALALERQGEIRAIPPASLAWHFGRAQLWEKAIHYGLLAAGQAVHHNALHEALQHLEQAEAHLGKLPDRTSRSLHSYLRQLYTQKAAVYDLLGHRDKQREAIQILETTAQRTADVEMQLQAHLHRIHWARITGRYQEAREEANKMRMLAGETQNALYEALAWRKLSLVHESVGEYEQALACNQKAQEIHTPLPESVACLAIPDHTEALRSYLGQFDKALASYQRKLTEAIAVQDPWVRMGLLNNLGICRESVGDYVEALSQYRSAFELAQQWGDLWMQGVLLCNMGSTLWGAGSLEEALARFEAALPILREIGHTRAELVVLVNMGTVHGDLGSYDQALRCFDGCLAAIQEKKLNDLEIEVLWRKSAVLLKLGQGQEAWQLSQRAVELIDKGGTLQNRIRAYFNHSQVLEANGQAEKARFFLKRAYEELMRRAQCIEQDDLRHMFLRNIRDHRLVLEQWQALEEKRSEN